jgi:hypothetical protein
MLLNQIKLLQGGSCEEHIQYYIWSLLGFFGRHVVDLVVSIVLLPLRLSLVP